MSTPVNPCAGIRPSQAAFAMALAIVLVGVAGFVQAMRPTLPADDMTRGTVERGESGALPPGLQRLGEGEVDGDSGTPAEAALEQPDVDLVAFVGVRVSAADAPALLARQRVSATGARGPPIA